MKFTRVRKKIIILAAVSIFYTLIGLSMIGENISNGNRIVRQIENEQISVLSEVQTRGMNETTVNLGLNRAVSGQNDFSNVYYIENADYFLANPKHAKNSTSDNPAGTCTTVAMQMLIGYHNYYTDRRLLPAVAEDGTQFLAGNYGDLNEHPIVLSSRELDYGRDSIGTLDSVYDGIFDHTFWGELTGLGQNIGWVRDGAVDFLNKYTNEDVEFTIQHGIFFRNQIHEELDAGRPAIIVCQPVFTGADTYHVMVVYGYADYKGSPGYIVHCGWQDNTAQMWYPESWIGFQIRMSVNHTHTFSDGYSNIQNTYRKIVCDTCGCTSLDHLYEISNNAISDINYPIEGEITIPSYIYGNPIEAIDTKFSDMAITKINLPYSLHNIANEAFENCDGILSEWRSNSCRKQNRKWRDDILHL